MEAGRTAPVRGLWSISTGFRHPFNDPFFYESESCPSSRQTGCESRTGCQFQFYSSASIEVMQQAFNLLSTEHSRGGGPIFSGSRTGRARRDCFESRSFRIRGMGSMPSDFRQFLQNGDHDVRAASGSVKTVVRVQVPLVPPLSEHARDAEVVEAAACKPALTRCKRFAR